MEPEEILEKIKDKFPIVYQNPYNKEIIKCLKKGHSAYSIHKWLKEKGETISSSRLTDLKNYLLSKEYITEEEIKKATKVDDVEINHLLRKKLVTALKNLDIVEANPNVQVQWILGVTKLLFGSSLQIDMNADVKTQGTHETDDTVLEELLNAIQTASD